MAELQQAPEEEKRGRGRPPANGTCIMWTEAMVETLLQLRFKTYMSELSVARGSKSLKQAWASLAEELSCQNNVVVSVEQCRNKIKALKSKWLAYHAGGMSAEPVCLALMDTFWEGDRNQAMHTSTSTVYFRQQTGGSIFAIDGRDGRQTELEGSSEYVRFVGMAMHRRSGRIYWSDGRAVNSANAADGSDADIDGERYTVR
ncbi:hypothetical protein JM16_007229 [Phytophthora kernoviae]|uniref:Myb/SANT-like DNA-binding domain-containing protein n=1 Tax=Phytophthora kernoviae TaxID=325452 RepID=A0A8T0LQT9_9STRA|nr:hypothetical protein JM16_007229 [Phytophthora kernoviae]